MVSPVVNKQIHSLGRTLRVGSDNMNVHKESAITGHSVGFDGTEMVGFQHGPGHSLTTPLGTWKGAQRQHPLC